MANPDSRFTLANAKRPVIGVRLQDLETYQHVVLLAGRDGLTVCAWVRNLIDKELQRVIQSYRHR